MFDIKVYIDTHEDIKFINVKDPFNRKAFYTNPDLRSSSKGYTKGIKNELWDRFDAEVLNFIADNIQSQSMTVDKKTNFESYIDSKFKIGVLAYNYELANAILNRSLLYCPEDKGTLKRSAVIQKIGDSYAVVYTAEYSWFVHEFTWRTISKDKNPLARHKWLEIAYDEIIREWRLA